MFCSNCGKELSDVAPICPNCGTPTNLNHTKKNKQIKEVDANEPQNRIFAVIGFVLSMIGIACIVMLCSIVSEFAAYVSYMYDDSVFYFSAAPAFAPVITVFGVLTVLIVIISFICCIIGIFKTANTQQKKMLALSISGLVFSSIEILLFIFVFFLVPTIYLV